MKKRGNRKKKRIIFAIVNGALLLVMAACLITGAVLSHELDSQREAERWRGEGELEFSQISCFIPVDEKIGLDKVAAFRTKMSEELHKAALDIDNDSTLFVDAWSCTGKVSVSSDNGKGDAAVIAVGGEFFEFHPLRLISGSYITQRDLMKDRVLLDEDLAWLLYGGTDIAGLSMKINGVPYMIAGVVEREQDRFSTSAYSSGRGLYMSYDGYAQLFEDAGISCYEVALANPVKGFALGVVKGAFPIGRGEIVENSRRFEFGRLLSIAKQFGSRSMQTTGVIYPYWENAARSVEDWCALLAFAALLCGALPAVTALVVVIRLLVKGKEKLEDDIVPQLVENTGEVIRAQQRKRWEKKHGSHEKRREKDKDKKKDEV